MEDPSTKVSTYKLHQILRDAVPAVTTSFIRHSIGAHRILTERNDLFWKVEEILHHFQDQKYLLNDEVDERIGEGEEASFMEALFAEGIAL